MKKPLLTTLVYISIFVNQILVFLAFYPGICSYDLNAQIEQYTTLDFCTSHPLLHTIFIGFFHSLFDTPKYGNNINLGYAIASIIQISIVTGAMAYSVMFLNSFINKRWVLICITVFYALFPVNSLLAISHTKDILFGAFALIFFIDSIRIISDRLPKRMPFFNLRMVVNLGLMSLMRNNATYALVASILIIVFSMICNKKNYIILRKYLLILLISIVFSVSAGRILINITGATPGSIKEMMSVPAQIMGRVYNTNASVEEQALISSYIPNTDEYNYYLADPMKHYLPFEIWESKCKHFLLDSAIISLHHPVIAIQAVWLNIQGFLDPFHQPYSYDRYYLAYENYRGGAELDSKFPCLCNLYLKLFSSTKDYCHTPLVILFNAGIYVWICIIACIILLRRFCNSLSAAYYFPIFYLLTLLLGPGAIMRYAYLYVLTAPISIYIIYAYANDSNSKPFHNTRVTDS